MSLAMSPTFVQDLPLADIALEDRTFIVTYQPDLAALQQSIARVGVLNPVHLRRSEPQAPWQIVCGSKRLRACQAVGRTRTPALLYEATALTEQQAFLLALHDNLGCRPLNAVEKARVLLRLQRDFAYPVPTLCTEYCPLLDLPPRPATIDTYCTLATLDAALQATVVDGTLPLETALWLGAYATADREALLPVFTGLKLGSNRAREFATYVDELCQRDACSASALLEQLRVPLLLHDPQLTGPQKIEQVRRVLRQARYPALSAHEQRFQDAVRQLRLPPQITLRPPPYFEGQQYQITFAFGQRQELQDYAQRLLDAAAATSLETLFELL